MKNKELNHGRSTDSEWNWINKQAGHYHTRQEVSVFLGNEKIRITFSNRIDDNSDNNRAEPLVEKPEKDVNNPDSNKPNKGDGGEIKKDKPEIRYDIE